MKHKENECSVNRKKEKEDFQGANPLEIRRPDTEVSVYHTIVSSLYSSFEFIENAVAIVVGIFVVIGTIVVVVELTGQWVSVVNFEPVG